MKIVVLGAGITGVTAAYVLASRGHEVEVIDQEDGAAQQTSFSNGAQLSYSHAEPWANPGVFKKVFQWMFKDDAPLVLRPRADMHMLRWMAMFLMHCTPARTRENCERMMRIGLYSKEKMTAIRKETKVKFDFSDKGILHVFSDDTSYQSAIKQAEFQETLGCKEHVFSKAECLEKEPALGKANKDIIGGIYSDIDETGDIHLFTKALSKYCAEKLNVTFSYNTRVLKLNTQKQRIVSVTTSRGEVSADTYVMALGPYSAPLLTPLGLRLPIYPMKGYSITIPAWDGAPDVSITDDEKKVVISRIGNRIRSAGTAEFAGYDTTVNATRIRQITDCVTDLFPDASLDSMEEWACIRPQTPDGPPIVGRTSYPNLFLNTGHGTLGWTQGAGTAYLLADIIDNKTPEISVAGLELSRYRK